MCRSKLKFTNFGVILLTNAREYTDVHIPIPLTAIWVKNKFSKHALNWFIELEEKFDNYSINLLRKVNVILMNEFMIFIGIG